MAAADDGTARTSLRNSILRISEEKTMELIELYRHEECLWNTKLKDYKNKDKRAKAAQRIARQLNIPKFDAKHVIVKFKNLRNSYSQELKKIANNHSYGDEEYRPTVFWFQTMDSFIRPHLQPARGSAYEYLVFPAGQEKEVEFGDELSPPTPPSPPPADACKTELVILPDTSHRLAELEIPDYPPPKRRRKTSAVTESLNQIKQEPEELHQEHPMPDINLSSTSSYNEDLYDDFGRYVAALLRTLPPHKSITLQPKIVKMITEYMVNPNSD